MKKVLSAVLLGVLVAVAAHAQPLKPKDKPLPSFDFKLPSFTQQLKEAQQKAQREAELNKKAFDSIPEKAKTTAVFQILDNITDEGIATFSDKRCSAIFMDYNEKDGLGNVTVGIKPDCVKTAIDYSFDWAEIRHEGWMRFNIYMTKFGYDSDRDEDGNEIYEYIYETELSSKEGTRSYPKLPFRKTEAGNLYTFQMPVPSSSAKFQQEFKRLFPSKKEHITLEKAARALRLIK